MKEDEREPERADSILSAAATLLGVALVIITAVHITGNAAQRFTDELAFIAAILLIASCLSAHRASSKKVQLFEQAADRLFFLAQFVLLAAVLSFWF